MFKKTLSFFLSVMLAWISFGEESLPTPEVEIVLPSSSESCTQLTISQDDASLADGKVVALLCGKIGSSVNFGAVAQRTPMRVDYVAAQSASAGQVDFVPANGTNNKGCSYASAEFTMPAERCVVRVSADNESFGSEIKILVGLTNHTVAAAPTNAGLQNYFESYMPQNESDDSGIPVWLIVVAVVVGVVVLAVVLLLVLLTGRRVEILELHCAQSATQVTIVYLHQLRRRGGFTIGRAANNDLTLNHTSVSAAHAALSISNNSVVIQDLHSTNGTFVNNCRVSVDSPRILSDGDTVKCAQVTITVKKF